MRPSLLLWGYRGSLSLFEERRRLYRKADCLVPCRHYQRRCPRWFLKHAEHTYDDDGAVCEFAGRRLMAHAPFLRPRSATAQEWDRDIVLLNTLVERRDNKAVLAWFITRFPTCLGYITSSGFPAFLRGVYWSYERGLKCEDPRESYARCRAVLQRS